MAREEVVASLEGMRVVVENKVCVLETYDFVQGRYREIARHGWPVDPASAETWLSGWNAVDRFDARRITG